MIQVENLSYGTHLHNLSFAVAPGQVLGLVGSAGNGKTSLLRILAGRALPTAGSASVGGVDCTTPRVRRMVGVVGDSWGLLPRLTVWENLQYFVELWGLPQSRVADGLKLLDLVALSNVRAEKLKPGEETRVRFARALLHDPPALLLDEPIGDIDRESASLITFAISEQAERGKAILLATYGHPKALEVCDQLLYLEDGQLVQPGSPAKEQAAARQTEAEAPIRHIAARRAERILLFAPQEERLEGEGFFRCHRAFLVNVQHVREIVAYTRDSLFLLLKDGKEIPLSKHRAVELKKRLGW